MDVAPRAGLRPFDTRSDFGAVRHGNLRWIQCEECITEYGFLAKHPTTGNAIPSPYVSMSQSFSKAGQQPVVPNLSGRPGELLHQYKGATPHDDMMERLLSARRGG